MNFENIKKGEENLYTSMYDQLWFITNGCLGYFRQDNEFVKPNGLGEENMKVPLLYDFYQKYRNRKSFLKIGT